MSACRFRLAPMMALSATLAFTGATGSAAGGGPMRNAGFVQLAQSTSADSKSTLFEIAFLCPVDKLLFTVDLSGGVDSFRARYALHAAPGLGIPPEGAPISVSLTPSQLQKVLETAAQLTSAAQGPFWVGIYAIQLSTSRTARLPLNQAAARKALVELQNTVPTGPANAAIESFRRAVFPNG